MRFEKIALVGNPNSGKTTLFNLLTGSRQSTGNWPGVTVEKKQGEFVFNQQKTSIIDLPGVYSLNDSSSSIDGRIAREFILSNPDYLYFNIIDGSTLERGLYLTTQLREVGVDIVVLVNMIDIVKKRNMKIDIKALEKLLGCTVIDISLKSGFKASFFASIIDKYQPIEHFAVDDSVAKANQEIELIYAEKRFNTANSIAKSVIKQQTNIQSASDKIDTWILGSWTGIPIFLVVMYMLFLFSINFGGALIDFFDLSAAAIFVDGMRYVLTQIGLPEFMITVLAEGIGGGIQVVATFIPIIAALYLFLSFLEETGYMARAAFVMNKFMCKIGLSGKAFIPLIIGFGCNVPGIMATRTLDSHRERVTTVMMSPFMSCDARLAVYALFAAAFFPVGGQNIVFLLYLIGVIFAIITGLILKSGSSKEQVSDFLIELPVYRLPSLRNLLINTWNKLKGFVIGAGKIIVLVVMMINVVNSIGVDGSFGNQDSEKSVLSLLAQNITPMFSPMGIENDNWPATVGIVTGVLAKEVVVGTLDSLYSNIDTDISSQQAQEEPFNFFKQLNEAVLTIPANTKDALGNLSDPLGLSILDDTHSQELASVSQEVSNTTFGAMVSRFDGKVGAFAYLLFILLYFPCVAATGAMVKEVGRKWGSIGVAWSTGLAYAVAVIFYQSATLVQHPFESALWIIGLSIVLVLAIYGLNKSSQKIGVMSIPITTVSS